MWAFVVLYLLKCNDSKFLLFGGRKAIVMCTELFWTFFSVQWRSVSFVAGFHSKYLDSEVLSNGEFVSAIWALVDVKTALNLVCNDPSSWVILVTNLRVIRIRGNFFQHSVSVGNQWEVCNGRASRSFTFDEDRTCLKKPSSVFLNCSVEIPTRCSFVIEYIIPKFFKGSTCFERHTAHHQEL